MIYIQLFFSFLKIGLFSVGGGYAAIPLIQSEIVNGSRLAQYAGIYQSYHDFFHDPRPCGN